MTAPRLKPDLVARIRAAVHRALDGTTCWCYRPDLLEYLPGEKCLHCELRDLNAELEQAS